MDSAELKKLEERVKISKEIENKITNLTNGLEKLMSCLVDRIIIDKKAEHHNVSCSYADQTNTHSVAWTRYFPEAPDELKALIITYFQEKLKTLKEEYQKL